MFRRGFATHFMNKGGKIHALSRILGHSQITTTMLYVCDIDTKSAMEKLWG
jgi:site-specific recombinase XerD